MRLDTSDDTFYNINNKKLSLPITIASANKYTLAYDSEKAQETSFGTRPIVLNDGTYTLAYEARGDNYRQWRLALHEDGKWSHGHPMPGTLNRTLHDKSGNKISNIRALDVLNENAELASAAVIYTNKNGESTIATATRALRPNNLTHNWKVDRVYFSVPKARMQMKAVKDDKSGNTIALVVNVRKGQSQRLYLWHDGEFRRNY